MSLSEESRELLGAFDLACRDYDALDRSAIQAWVCTYAALTAHIAALEGRLRIAEAELAVLDSVLHNFGIDYDSDDECYVLPWENGETEVDSRAQAFTMWISAGIRHTEDLEGRLRASGADTKRLDALEEQWREDGLDDAFNNRERTLRQTADAALAAQAGEETR